MKKWIETYLFEIISPVRYEQAEVDIAEIIDTFTANNQENLTILTTSVNNISDRQLDRILDSIHASAKKWMQEVYYHRTTPKKPHPSLLVFK